MVAGYSGTPQARKLGIKPGSRIRLTGAPDGWDWEALPDGAIELGSGPADVIVAFVTAAARVGDQITGLAPDIYPAGGLWLAWPRKAAGHVSDVDENLIRATALAHGLVDVKVAALDHDWSALKLVWRKENRGSPTPPEVR
jgi:hypothetical protein